MVIVNRFEQRKVLTRQILLDAAESVFSEIGYNAATIIDITDAANVSKRTFYLHFKDKEDLIEQIAQRSFEKVRLEINEQFKTIGEHNMREGHYHVVKAIFEFTRANPELMQIVVGPDGSHRLNAMAREYMATAMVIGFEEDKHCHFKENPAVPKVIMANAIGGAVFQLLCWWVRTPNDYSPDDMAAMSAALFFDPIAINFDRFPGETLE